MTYEIITIALIYIILETIFILNKDKLFKEERRSFLLFIGANIIILWFSAMIYGLLLILISCSSKIDISN